MPSVEVSVLSEGYYLSSAPRSLPSVCADLGEEVIHIAERLTPTLSLFFIFFPPSVIQSILSSTSFMCCCLSPVLQEHAEVISSQETGRGLSSAPHSIWRAD